MRSQDIEKKNLYEGVKALVDSVESGNKHIHLNQQKLFTLYSIGFQYLLFRSTKKPGAYIIRIEDSSLVNKLSKKAKDLSSRRFLQSLALPRKIKYGKSMFYLDFFHIGSWSLTSEIPKDKIQGALIVKNTSEKPMMELMEDESLEEENPFAQELPKDYFLTSLTEFVPVTITIAYNSEFDNLKELSFPFISKEKEKVRGLTLSKEIDLDQLED